MTVSMNKKVFSRSLKKRFTVNYSTRYFDWSLFRLLSLINGLIVKKEDKKERAALKIIQGLIRSWNKSTMSDD